MEIRSGNFVISMGQITLISEIIMLSQKKKKKNRQKYILTIPKYHNLNISRSHLIFDEYSQIYGLDPADTVVFRLSNVLIT